MERHTHGMSNLFAQLGPSHDPEDIAQFIEANRPLAGDVRLRKASFCSPS